MNCKGFFFNSCLKRNVKLSNWGYNYLAKASSWWEVLGSSVSFLSDKIHLVSLLTNHVFVREEKRSCTVTGHGYIRNPPVAKGYHMKVSAWGEGPAGGWGQEGCCLKLPMLRVAICEPTVMKSSPGRIRRACQLPRWDCLELIDSTQSPKRTQCIPGTQRTPCRGFPRIPGHGEKRLFRVTPGRRRMQWLANCSIFRITSIWIRFFFFPFLLAQIQTSSEKAFWNWQDWGCWTHLNCFHEFRSPSNLI